MDEPGFLKRNKDLVAIFLLGLGLIMFFIGIMVAGSAGNFGLWLLAYVILLGFMGMTFFLAGIMVLIREIN